MQNNVTQHVQGCKHNESQSSRPPSEPDNNSGNRPATPLELPNRSILPSASTQPQTQSERNDIVPETPLAENEETHLSATSTPTQDNFSQTAWFRDVRDHLSPKNFRAFETALQQLSNPKIPPANVVNQLVRAIGNNMRLLNGINNALPRDFQLICGINGWPNVVRLIGPDFLDEVCLQEDERGNVTVELIARHRANAATYDPRPAVMDANMLGGP